MISTNQGPKDVTVNKNRRRDTHLGGEISCLIKAHKFNTIFQKSLNIEKLDSESDVDKIDDTYFIL